PGNHLPATLASTERAAIRSTTRAGIRSETALDAADGRARPRRRPAGVLRLQTDDGPGAGDADADRAGSSDRAHRGRDHDRLARSRPVRAGARRRAATVSQGSDSV